MTDADKDPKDPRSSESPHPKPDEVIRIEDLAPREDVRGGRKIILGEVVPDSDPASSSQD